VNKPMMSDLEKAISLAIREERQSLKRYDGTSGADRIACAITNMLIKNHMLCGPVSDQHWKSKGVK